MLNECHLVILLQQGVQIRICDILDVFRWVLFLKKEFMSEWYVVVRFFFFFSWASLYFPTARNETHHSPDLVPSFSSLTASEKNTWSSKNWLNWPPVTVYEDLCWFKNRFTVQDEPVVCKWDRSVHNLMDDLVIPCVRLWAGWLPGSHCWGNRCRHRGLAVAGQPAAEWATHLWRVSGVTALGGHRCPLLFRVSKHVHL